MVGSIGVISGNFGFVDMIKKLGIEARTMTAGENKDFNNPFKPRSEKGEAITRRLLDKLHENFKDHVRSARGDRIKKSDESRLFSGDIWVGQEAIDIGLADEIGTVNSYIEREFGGKDKVRAVQIKSPGPWWAEAFSKGQMEVGFDQKALAEDIVAAIANRAEEEAYARPGGHFKM